MLDLYNSINKDNFKEINKKMKIIENSTTM